tara:strand:+ start:279 stop:482 length:204 start_codon:yes stop_codon:yes gene_type:complete
MAVPKKRRSKSKSRIKKAAWTITLPETRPCPNCQYVTLAHVACPACGYYKGKQVVNIKVKDKSSKDN